MKPCKFSLIFLILFYLIAEIKCFENVNLHEISTISLTNYINPQKEFISNLLISHNGKYCFALVGNTYGYKQKIIVVNLSEKPYKILIKDLILPIARLEMITKNDNFLITKNLEILEISSLIEESANPIKINLDIKNSFINAVNLTDIACIKPLANKKHVFISSRTRISWIFNIESNYIMRELVYPELIKNCAGITTTFFDSTIYAIYKNNISQFDYFTTYSISQRKSQLNINENTTSDISQQIYVSPLGNYVIYLTENNINLFKRSLGNITFVNKFGDLNSTQFNVIGFINDTLFLASEYLSSTHILFSIDPFSHNITEISQYSPKIFFGTAIIKPLNSREIAICDSTSIKIIAIYDSQSAKSKETGWNFGLFIFGIIMAFIMILFAIYFLYFKSSTNLQNLQRNPNIIISGNNNNIINSQDSIATENIPTEQDLSNKSNLVIKKALKCPLTQQIMNEPVIISDGYSYEKKIIEEWLRRNCVSPITGSQIKQDLIIPNLTLEKIIKIYDSQKKQQVKIKETGTTLTNIQT